MSNILRNPPVYYVLAKVQFNFIANMADYAGSIQEKFRTHGFDGYNHVKTKNFQLELSADGQATTAVVEVDNWHFFSGDRRHGFILTPEALVYHTTGYTSHEHFIDQCVQGLSYVHNTVQLASVSQIGMRYLDAVIPSAEHAVDRYLSAPFREFALNNLASMNSVTQHNFVTSMPNTDAPGYLLLKLYQQTSPVGFPPDLQNHILFLPEHIVEAGSVKHAMIDIDHVWPAQMPFNIDAVKNRLSSVYEICRSAFDQVVTPWALEQWGDVE